MIASHKLLEADISSSAHTTNIHFAPIGLPHKNTNAVIAALAFFLSLSLHTHAVIAALAFTYTNAVTSFHTHTNTVIAALAFTHGGSGSMPSNRQRLSHGKN